ncbi:MAG: hypothetical protein EBX52_02820, partial [Proteobacteria bacterium]|nr:hypothetical protein [Pseudomonadota bacterium]
GLEAAAQEAAVETRRDHAKMISILKPLHHEPTLRAVKSEREVLLEWGGGCHQKLGASALPSGVLFVQGQKPSGEWVNETRGAKQPDQSGFTKIEAQDVFDFTEAPLSRTDLDQLDSSNVVFIAHSRAFDFLKPKDALRAGAGKRIWVSGTRSWFKLAREGVFVEGSLDGQGYDALQTYRAKRLLEFPSAPVLFLSHRESPEAGGARVIGTYRHEFREIPQKFHENDSIYWSSGLPFLLLWDKLGGEIFKQKRHACGPGRTARQVGEKLAAVGVVPTILSME